MQDEYLDDYWQYKSRVLIAKRNRLEKRLEKLFMIGFSFLYASIILLAITPFALVFTSISGIYIGKILLTIFITSGFSTFLSWLFVEKVGQKISALPTSKSLSADELKVAYLNSLKRWDDE